MSQKRLPLLDLTRWFAALAVVIFHYFYMVSDVRNDYPYAQCFIKYAYLAVQLFFIISGFVIFMSVDNKKGPFVFLTSRFIRLYPAYIISVFLTFAFVYLIPISYPFDFNDFFGNLTMIPSLLGSKPANPAYWSLAIEIFFYLYVFILLFFVSNIKKLYVFMLLWLLISILNIFCSIQFLEKLFLLKYCSLFVGGAGLYMHARFKNIFYLYAALLSLPVSIYYAIEHSIKLSNILPYFYFSSYTVSFIVSIFYAWVCFSSRIYNLKWIDSNVISLLAGSSYVLYVIHETIGRELIQEYYERFEHFLILIAILAVILSLIIHAYLEKPLSLYLKKIKKTNIISAVMSKK
ncbi:TPA: acyltransferase family protein [Klebsiella pneumoniae]